jgi:hypothetical protein
VKKERKREGWKLRPREEDIHSQMKEQRERGREGGTEGETEGRGKNKKAHAHV